MFVDFSFDPKIKDVRAAVMHENLVVITRLGHCLLRSKRAEGEERQVWSVRATRGRISIVLSYIFSLLLLLARRILHAN